MDGTEMIADLVRDALVRAFTAELPRTARANVEAPRITVAPSYRHPGRFFVNVQFEVEFRP